MGILMKKGKYLEVIGKYNNINNDVEYEKIVRDLRMNVEKRHQNIVDLRNKNEYSLDNIADKTKSDFKTLLLMPGVSEDSGKSYKNPYKFETDQFSRRLDWRSPHSHGVPWSDN